MEPISNYQLIIGASFSKAQNYPACTCMWICSYSLLCYIYVLWIYWINDIQAWGLNPELQKILVNTQSIKERCILKYLCKAIANIIIYIFDTHVVHSMHFIPNVLTKCIAYMWYDAHMWYRTVGCSYAWVMTDGSGWVGNAAAMKPYYY